jgi:peptidyl-prolyl cis-trans isomerase C
MKPGIIRGQLKSRVKRFIERELLVREAYDKGLNELPEVQASIDMWRDSYLAKMMKNRFYDSAEVSDQEAREYFDNRDENEGFVKKVNIVEILVDSLEMVEEIFRRLDEGSDFRELAVRFTQREWTIKNEGEFGFFPVTEYGEIGRTAADMEVGEIFGPLEVPEGYSIFKLIDVKKEAEKLPDSFEKAKSKIKEKLKMQKVKDIMVDETIRLADKYGVSVDKNLLNSISVKNYNMLVYRYMGFGGRITAVPQTIPFTEWIKYWDKSDKVLP